MVQDIPLLAIVVVLGLLVLASYVWTFRNETQSYLESRFWLGYDKRTTIGLTVMQVLAAVGFVTAMSAWIFVQRPQGGLLGQNKWALPFITAVMLAASVVWAPMSKRGLDARGDKWWVHGAVVASLVITAICSILLLAGAAEETNPRWYVLLGMGLFSFTTVLADGVAWSARYIRMFTPR